MAMYDSISTLQNGLSAAWLRNQTILHNVANNDTPNFQASGVSFETLYKDAMDSQLDGFDFKKTRATHMDFGNRKDPRDVVGVVAKKTSSTYRMDGNNVDIDQETTDFAKNYIFYNSLLRKVNGQFSQLNAAIKGQ